MVAADGKKIYKMYILEWLKRVYFRGLSFIQWCSESEYAEIKNTFNNGCFTLQHE